MNKYMKPFGIIIADHDKPCMDHFQQMIDPLRHFHLLDVAEHARDLWKKIQLQNPEILIMNLSLPGIRGVSGIEKVKQFHPYLQIILMTDDDTFPGEVFDISLTDYMKKPVIQSRFYDSLKKAFYSLNSTHHLSGGRVISGKLEIRMNHSLLFIPFHEIVFIERLNRKSFIYTFQHTYETYESLHSLMERLGYQFFQSHRSYIVNLEHIYKIEPDGQTYLVHFRNYKKVHLFQKTTFKK